MGSLSCEERTSLCSIEGQSVFVDLEIHPKTKLLLKIGAWSPAQQQEFYVCGYFDRTQALQNLFEFIQGFAFIVGHNIEAHDWPYLVKQDVKFADMKPRLIDTLVLNPLAFPANPYHYSCVIARAASHCSKAKG